MLRRTFFKSSIALSVGLIAWRQGVLVPAEKIKQKLSEFGFLKKRDIALLKTALPAVLPFKKWQVEELSLFAAGLNQTIELMQPNVQNEVRQLFDLFHIKPFLWWMGITSIETASPASFMQMLAKMKKSRVPDLRAASMAFNELVCAVYYASPNTDTELGYHAPTELL